MQTLDPQGKIKIREMHKVIPFLTIIGSCVSAGYRDCCMTSNCRGEPNDCFCDNLCVLYGDCCADANTNCNFNSKLL